MEDGGYQLAMKLEASSAWRPWLGEQLYSEFRMHLGSPAAWAAFMKPSEMSRLSPAHLRLQMKVRALLYDKALELPDTRALSSQLNPTYLQLKPDSIYFTLEQDALDWTRLLTEGSSSMAALQAKYGLDHRDVLSHHAAEPVQQFQPRKHSAITPKVRSGPGLRGPDQSKVFGRMPLENTRSDTDDEKSLESDLWYDQWFDKRLTERMHRLARRLAQLKLPFPEQEALRRTPEGMASFVSARSRARKRDQLFVGDSQLEREQDFPDADLGILPELTTISNCVPENPCLPTSKSGINIESTTPVAANGESLLSGLSRQLLSGGSGDKVKLSADEADHLARKTVGKILEAQGFEGVRQIPLDVLTEVMVMHIRKLGSWLRMLLDGYQKSLSPDEFLRMFMQRVLSPARFDHPDSSTSVSSATLRDLADYIKNEKVRFSHTPQTDNNTPQQYHQLQVHSRHFPTLQQTMYLENVLKKKQLPSIRGNKMREELVGGAAYAAMSKQPWGSQQMPHSQVLQQLKQQLQLPTAVHQLSAKSDPRIEGLQEMLRNDVMKQETPDDLEAALGSPNKRKRKDY